MKLLTNEQQKLYDFVKICYIYKQKFKDKHAKDKKYRKVKDYRGAYRDRGAAHSICNLKYYLPRKNYSFP